MFLQIYGPLQISAFNISIGLGILTFIFFALKDSRLKNLINKNDFINLTIETAIVAIIGGRLLCVLGDLENYNNFFEFFTIWNGGLSVQGAVISAVLYSWYFLNKRKIEFLKVLDIAAIYAPLIHAIARIGCFFVGCCHGAQTNSFISVVYTNPTAFAPLNIPLHPTQLYSSFLYLIIFCFLFFISKKYNFHKGTILVTYIILSSFERILVDFIRGDRVFSDYNLFNLTINRVPIFSFYQLISIGMIFAAGSAFFLNRFRDRKKNESF